MRPTSHEDLAEQLNRGSEKFVMIEERLSEISTKLECLPQMQKDISATKEIVEAWGAIKTFGKFFKWVGGVVAGLLAFILIAKASVKGLL